MPSLLHEGMVRLFHDRPELAPTLLRDVLGLALPSYTDVQVESTDLGDLEPAARHADIVVLLVRGEPVLGIVVEVQLRVDPDKTFSWPAYLTNLRARLRCDVELLVVTPARVVAQWAMNPIPVGQGSIRPLVIGPDGLPVMKDRGEAERDPELAVLSAMAHGQDDAHVAVPSALAALSAVAGFEDRRALLYSDLVWVALSDAARAALEALMKTEGYEYQSEFARRYFAEGKHAGKAEGKAEGRAEGKAEVVLKLLSLKFGPPSVAVRSRVEHADIEELDRWAERILSAARLEDVFV